MWKDSSSELHVGLFEERSLLMKYFTVPIKAELTFCEEFINSVPPFIDNFVLYFHQIYHVDTASKSDESRFELNQGK